jgi:DNA-binding transcriptional regulator GbsR (MarR family)
MTARDAVTDLEDLKQRRSALQLRLEDGYQRIEQALKDGKDVTRWEDFWVQLLDEYVRICDTIRELE